MANILTSALGMAMLSGGGDDPAAADKLAQVGAVVQGLGLDGVRWIGGSDWREASGRVKGTMIVSTTPGAAGLLPSCLAGTGTIDRKLVERVPGDSLSMGAGSIDWLPAVYDFAMSTFKSIDPVEYESVQTTIKGFMGESDLRNDLLANLHGTVLSYQVPGEGIADQPANLIRVGVKDPEAFLKALRTLTASVSGMFLDSPDAVSIKESEHEGRKLYELDISRTPMGIGMVQPAFAIDGTDLVLCPQSTKALKTALNGTPVETSLAKNEKLSAFIDTLADKGELSSLSFADNAKIFGVMYGGLASAAQMFGGAAGDIPVDLSLMPSEQAITKHLSQSWSGGYATDGGATRVWHSDGQFQVGDFLPLLVTGGIVGFSIATGGDALGSEPEVLDPFEIVQGHLGQISAGMMVYKISQDRYPDSIDDLVKPLADYPDGCLGQPEVPVDPWGNPYRYKLNAKGKPQLWSTGPDGVDQGGESDDIVKS
ncbi:MAG TPA: type II secretion system protein GspG, partial [Planctomycetota bacterium]|nr:type II secretion system protein GspG [Planctomycetota bacterium]